MQSGNWLLRLKRNLFLVKVVSKSSVTSTSNKSAPGSSYVNYLTVKYLNEGASHVLV